MLKEKVPEIAYKKGVDESEGPAKRPALTRRCLFALVCSSLALLLVLVVVLVFALRGSSIGEDEMRSLVSEVRATVCDLPSETGPCRAHFEKFFFDQSSKRCESFVYGGCAGNDNNFETEEECLALCGPEPKLTECPERFKDPETQICMLSRAFVNDIKKAAKTWPECVEGHRKSPTGDCVPV